LSTGGTDTWVIEIGVLVPAILSAALPSPFTMRTFADNPESVKTLRIGEVVGGVMVVALGIAESIDHHSFWPMVVILIFGAAWYGYIEWALRNPMSSAHNMASGAPAAPASNILQAA
jgi:hypothetical protein